MSSDQTDSAKPAKKEGTGIGARVGRGVSGAAKLVLGIGDTIRGLMIDIADFGKGSGKKIAEDGKVQAREGLRELEGTIRR